jgi:hypothetical protein
MATRKWPASSADMTQVKETIEAVNAVTTKVAADKSKVPLKTIAVRINEVDYNRLNSLFTAQGTNLSAAGRAAIFYLAQEVESGKLSIPNGVIYHNR